MSSTSRILDNIVNPKVTPQNQAIPGRASEMRQNNAGGVVFTVDKWTRLGRFLILGSEGGTYYVTEKKLTQDNANCALECLAEDGLRVVRTVVEISDGGRAPKNGPALFVLALAAKMGDDATRQAAFAAIPKVARIGTHLFELAGAMQTFGGWGRGTQRAFSSWYTNRSPASLAMQLAKYQSREGWSHRDVLRLAKPKGHERGSEKDRLLGWATGKWSPDLTASAPSDATRLIWAFEMAKTLAPAEPAPTKDPSKATLASAFEKAGKAKLATVTGGPGSKGGKTSHTTKIVNLINEFGLPRECIPTQFLNEVSVWEALLDNQGQGMPITALIRNLPKMTSIGLLTQSSEATKRAVALISDQDVITKGRVHPLAILVALKTYASGRGIKGDLTWSPVAKIVDALDKAFYLSFGNVESTGKRWMLALDVSGSMQGAAIAGLPGVTCDVAAAAMAMITAASEPETTIVAFSSIGGNNFAGMGTQWGSSYNTGISDLDLSPRRRLDDNLQTARKASAGMGGTDCSLPILCATERDLKIDVFVIYTDSETWAGNIQPVQALKLYRQKTGINAKLIVVGMTATEFTIADPKDAGMLDVVGFDTAAPNIMAAFARGDF